MTERATIGEEYDFTTYGEYPPDIRYGAADMGPQLSASSEMVKDAKRKKRDAIAVLKGNGHNALLIGPNLIHLAEDKVGHSFDIHSVPHGKTITVVVGAAGLAALGGIIYHKHRT